MKIAYLMNIYPMTSTTFIRREILALERQGIEIFRIALRGWDSDAVDEQDRAECKRTRYVLRAGALPLLLALANMLLTRPVRLMRAICLAWRMGQHADRPVLVHFVYLTEACLIEPWLRKAGVQHLHTHFGTNSAEVAMLVHLLGGPNWSFTVHGPEEFDKAQFIGLGEKIRRCAFVVAVSSYGRSQLYRWIGPQHWSKVQVVHCGLEKEYFARPVIPVPAVRRLVCVGRLCEQKGQLLLIEATRRLVARGVDFELVLAGDGEMRCAIDRLLRHYNLQDRVRTTGWISGLRVQEEILSARALVLPSFAEGLPVVIMEAMALRRLVISTFVGGIPELVRTGEHGWLVPAGDLEALMHAIQACLDTPDDVLNRMGEAAHQRVLARHSVDAQTVLLGNLFAAGIEGRMNFSNGALLERDELSETKPISRGGTSK